MIIGKKTKVTINHGNQSIHIEGFVADKRTSYGRTEIQLKDAVIKGKIWVTEPKITKKQVENLIINI